MKKKWIIGTSIILFVIAIVVILIIKLLPSPKQQEEVEKSLSFKEECWNHVTDCKTEEQSDGTVTVVLIAPDYVKLIDQLAQESEDEITDEMIKQAVTNNPNMVKEYSFVAKSADEEDVRGAFVEHISYELMALTLEGIMG